MFHYQPLTINNIAQYKILSIIVDGLRAWMTRWLIKLPVVPFRFARLTAVEPYFIISDKLSCSWNMYPIYIIDTSLIANKVYETWYSNENFSNVRRCIWSFETYSVAILRAKVPFFIYIFFRLRNSVSGLSNRIQNDLCLFRFGCCVMSLFPFLW